MKKMILVLALAVGAGVPAYAQEQQSDLKGQVVRGLVNVVKHQVEKRKQAKADKAAEEPEQEEPQSKLQPIAKIVGEALSPKIAEVKEHYKEEGRAYARELGDVIAERILANPRVKRALTVLEVLAGALAAYLSLVTLKLLSSLRAIRRNTERLLKATDAKCKSDR